MAVLQEELLLMNGLKTRLSRMETRLNRLSRLTTATAGQLSRMETRLTRLNRLSRMETRLATTINTTDGIRREGI